MRAKLAGLRSRRRRQHHDRADDAREEERASEEDEERQKIAKKNKKAKRGKLAQSRKPQPRIGSAAADWSRWPVGTTFKVLSTGQVYKVDDYGWALAGRNTIDLYMASRAT